MQLTKTDGTKLDLFAISFEHDPLVNYKLTKGTSNNYFTRDRGAVTDQFETVLYFRGKTSYIKELYKELKNLRDDSEFFVLSDFQVNIFSDLVDHSFDITCGITEMSVQKNPVLNIEEFNITLVASNPVEIATSTTLPNMKCMQNDWRGSAEWSYKTKRSYNGNLTVADRQSDELHFKGKYILTLEENTQLMAYWLNYRGRPFTALGSDWGVDNMFGDDFGNSNTVVIKDIEYKVTSPTQRQVTVDLYRVGVSKSVIPPETVNYFEAGTVEHPFNELEWTTTGFGYSAITDGEILLTGTSASGSVLSQNSVRGTHITKFISEMKIIAGFDSNVYGEMIADGTDNRVVWTMIGGQLRVRSVVDGVNSSDYYPFTDFVSGDIFKTTALFNNAGDMDLTIEITRAESVIHTLNHTKLSCLSATANYRASLRSYYRPQETSYIYIQGDGYPYTKEV